MHDSRAYEKFRLAAADGAGNVTPVTDVSVIIATRDRADLLRQAVDSVLAQDFDGDIEVIAVFDQSEPMSGLGRSTPGRTVRVIANDRTPGLAGARNTGIAAAAGTLVAFCDDDDTWVPHKLRLQIEAMDRLGAVAAVAGIEIHYGDVVRYRVPEVDRITSADLARSRLTGAHPSTFVIRRRDLLDHVGPVDEELPFGYGEDYDLLIRLARHGTVAVVRAPLAVVLWHPGSYFSRRWEAMSSGLAYLAEKHPQLRADRRGHAWIEGQRAFALAAMGRRTDAARTAARSIRLNPREARGPLALAVASGLVSPRRVVHALNARGRGI